MHGRIDDATWQFAQERLLEQWSREQISGHAAISPETVYQRVYADKRAGGLLWKNLRCQKQLEQTQKGLSTKHPVRYSSSQALHFKLELAI